MVVALFLAAALTSDRLRGKCILRTLFCMPSIRPASGIFIIISGLHNPNLGWITRLFHLSSFTPLYTLFPVILSLWTVGPGFLIMLGAMQAVPKELYEVAHVDGAGPVNRFISIIIPQAVPAIVPVAFLQFFNTWNLLRMANLYLGIPPDLQPISFIAPASPSYGFTPEVLQNSAVMLITIP